MTRSYLEKIWQLSHKVIDRIEEYLREKDFYEEHVGNLEKYLKIDATELYENLKELDNDIRTSK